MARPIISQYEREEYRREGSYHEAAHAVYAWLSEWGIRGVSIATPDRPELRDTCMTRIPIFAKFMPNGVIGALVGIRAQAWIHLGKPFSPTPFEEFVEAADEVLEYMPEMAGDDEDALLGLRRLHSMDVHKPAGVPLPWPWGKTMEETYCNLCNAAEQFVNDYWLEIEEVAKGLLEHGYLNGNEVERLVLGSLQRRLETPLVAQEFTEIKE